MINLKDITLKTEDTVLPSGTRGKKLTAEIKISSVRFVSEHIRLTKDMKERLQNEMAYDIWYNVYRPLRDSLYELHGMSMSSAKIHHQDRIDSEFKKLMDLIDFDKQPTSSKLPL